jgi:hypothetical protein
MKTLLLGLLVSFNALAWGPTGHRVVGEIAEAQLDIDVLVKVRKILNGASLSRVANWPDEIKSEPQTYQSTFSWHYTDWADDAHDHNEETSSGSLLKSIREQTAVLQNPAATDDQKAFALKFVVHLVGDLHQPLHVGNGLDLGGNNCKVIFQGKPTNLHALWDEGMINFTMLSFSEMTKYVQMGRPVATIRSWRSGDVVSWAQESKSLRGLIYPPEVTSSSQVMSVKSYCRKDIPVTTADMPNLSFEYSYKFVPVMEERLHQAGVRLAYLLNQALK